MKKQVAVVLAAGAGAAALGKWMSARKAEPIEGKVVLVTGSSRGLGFILARQLLARDCKVAICGRDPEALHQAEDELRQISQDVFAATCDVANEDDVSAFVARVVDRFGRVDVLINNAGILTVGPFDSVTRSDVEHAMDTMFWGTYNTTMAVLPSMRARGEGQVVNITSIGGKVAVPHLLPYSVAKFATVGLSEGLAAELGSEGIGVTTVVPGLMRTGSYINGLFKGQNTREYTWFSVLANLPVTSSDAERAAGRIIRGIERRETEVFITPVAHLAARAHGVLPGGIVQVLGVVDRVLPSSGDGQMRAARGRESENRITQSPITRLGQSAAARFQHVSAPGSADT